MANNLDLGLLTQIGIRISYLRKERHLSQLSLAMESLISPTYLCDLEAGRRNPSLQILARIAKGLDVSLEELFKGIGEIEELL